MSIKINKLEIENVKRIKAVRVEPTANGLTVIGGKNNQGKTSVLDAIAWALGGDKYHPTNAQREGSVIPPSLRVVLNNGLVIERAGKNSALKVIDPNGNKGGQQLLNDFVEQLALDLPKFMGSTSKEKAIILLQIIGVGDKLYALEQQENEIYNRRRTIGQISDQKAKFAKEQPYHTDAPKELVSASDLIKQQQDILAQNGENQRKRNRVANIEKEVAWQRQAIDDLRVKLAEAETKFKSLNDDLLIAGLSAQELHDESTAELEASIANIEDINRKVRANLDKDKAEEDAQHYAHQYDALTTELDQVRQAKLDLLKSADLPLPGLSVVDGELTYQGKKWDCMSGSEQLQVSTAIVRKLKPECGFVLLDKLEQMDLDTLQEFGTWLEKEGLQAIATRVSTGDECSVLIEDGYVVGQEQEATPDAPAVVPTWKAGMF